MTSSIAAPAPSASATAQLWALLAGNFVIGTGVLLPAGMLGPMASDLGVSVATAGWLMLAGGLTIGFGAPLFAALTSRFDRRSVLLASLALYVVGHLASAIAPNFAVLLALRVITVVGAGLFTPQAAAAVGLLVTAEKRAAGVAFIFLGWSVSLVSGTSIASLIATYLGWRMGYLILAVLTLAALVWVAASIPKGLRSAPLSVSSWLHVFGKRVMLLVLLVTVASSAGQFTVLTYLQPALKTLYGASPGAIAGVLAGFGVFGIAGNALASRLVAAWGTDRLVLALLIAMLVGFVVLGLSAGSLAMAAIGVAIWGFGTFGSNSLQQARLIGIDPALASASVALNTSAIYLGQAIGPAVGGPLVTASGEGLLAWAAVAFLALATGLSAAAQRLRARAAG